MNFWKHPFTIFVSTYYVTINPRRIRYPQQRSILKDKDNGIWHLWPCCGMLLLPQQWNCGHQNCLTILQHCNDQGGHLQKGQLRTGQCKLLAVMNITWKFHKDLLKQSTSPFARVYFNWPRWQRLKGVLRSQNVEHVCKIMPISRFVLEHYVPRNLVDFFNDLMAVDFWQLHWMSGLLWSRLWVVVSFPDLIWPGNILVDLCKLVLPHL